MVVPWLPRLLVAFCPGSLQWMRVALTNNSLGSRRPESKIHFRCSQRSILKTPIRSSRVGMKRTWTDPLMLTWRPLVQTRMWNPRLMPMDGWLVRNAWFVPLRHLLPSRPGNQTFSRDYLASARKRRRHLLSSSLRVNRRAIDELYDYN